MQSTTNWVFKLVKLVSSVGCTLWGLIPSISHTCMGKAEIEIYKSHALAKGGLLYIPKAIYCAGHYLIMLDWMVVLGFKATLTAKVISWQSVTHVFPGFLTPVLTQLFFPKQPSTFLTCFCRGERRKYTGNKSPLNRGSNSQPPGHESSMLTTEPPRRGASSCFHKINFVKHQTMVELSFGWLIVLVFNTTLTHSVIHYIETVSNSKKLLTTTEMWLLKDYKIQIA